MSNHDDQHFDPSIDYYQILGVDKSASAEDLKSAYLNLVKLHHPDKNPEKEDSTLFIQISDAWNILSKPELKSLYDAMRNGIDPKLILKPKLDFHETLNSSGFHKQRENYTANVKKRASSNWKEIASKYKLEKWQNLPLDKKKIHRSVKVNSMPKAFMTYGIPLIFIGGVLGTIALNISKTY